jgi:hypothetical protein
MGQLDKAKETTKKVKKVLLKHGEKVAVACMKGWYRVRTTLKI